MKKVQKDSITPFYASSTKHKTSSEIINEARAVIQKGMIILMNNHDYYNEKYYTHPKLQSMLKTLTK